MKYIIYFAIATLLTITYQTPLLPQFPELEEREESEEEFEPEELFDAPQQEEILIEETTQKEKDLQPLIKHQMQNMPTFTTPHLAESAPVDLSELEDADENEDEEIANFSKEKTVISLPSAEELEEKLECPEIETIEK